MLVLYTTVQIMACRLCGAKALSEPMLDYYQLNKALGTNFSEILIKIQNSSFRKMHRKTSSSKWWPFCPGGDELSKHPTNHRHISAPPLDEVLIFFPSAKHCYLAPICRRCFCTLYTLVHCNHVCWQIVLMVNTTTTSKSHKVIFTEVIQSIKFINQGPGLLSQ